MIDKAVEGNMPPIDFDACEKQRTIRLASIAESLRPLLVKLEQELRRTSPIEDFDVAMETYDVVCREIEELIAQLEQLQERIESDPELAVDDQTAGGLQQRVRSFCNDACLQHQLLTTHAQRLSEDLRRVEAVPAPAAQLFPVLISRGRSGDAERLATLIRGLLGDLQCLKGEAEAAQRLADTIMQRRTSITEAVVFQQFGVEQIGTSALSIQSPDPEALAQEHEQLLGIAHRLQRRNDAIEQSNSLNAELSEREDERGVRKEQLAYDALRRKKDPKLYEVLRLAVKDLLRMIGDLEPCDDTE